MKNALFALLAFVLFAFGGCKRDTDNFDGPSLIDRFGDFAVVADFSANREEVNFSEGETVIFSAEFNKNVDWVIEITGTVSGAVKRITGFDRIIDDENATWNGSTTNLPFFRAEPCTVTLKVPEEPEFEQSLEIEVLGGRNYPGNVFIDFETDPGQNLTVGNVEFELTPASGRRNDFIAAQEEYYDFLEGTDNVVTNFFVGLIDIHAQVAGSTYAPLPTTVPSQLYFNAFLWHDSSPHGIAVIQFIVDSNNSGAFEDGQDAVYQLDGDFPLNWNGWRHIHHPMSAVGISSDDLQKLVAIRVLLISNNNTQSNPPTAVRFGIDYLTFTQGGPLPL
jgi:hypothetical protein